jgi:hypothetical protein
MSYALGLYGLVRCYPSRLDVEKFLSLFPENSTIDVFISVPDVIDEYLNVHVNIDVERIKSLFEDRTVVLKTYTYDPAKYINRARDLGLPDYNPVSDYHPYRQLSLLDSIATISGLIPSSYDNIVLTRFDLLKTTTHLGTLEGSDTIYGYRHSQPGMFEDRLIVSGKRGLMALSNIYNTFDVELCGVNFYSELYIGKYLELFPELKKRTAEVNIDNSEWTHGKDGKYSYMFKNYINSVIRNTP